MNQTFNLKSSIQAVYLLELNSTDLDQIYEKLQFIGKTTPNLIIGAPVVLNLEHIEVDVSKEFLFELLTMLKGFCMHPIAAQTSLPEIRNWLKKVDLASHKISQTKHKQSIIEQKIELSTMTVESLTQKTIYAENQHIMVLCDVPKDYEIIADGNITILGNLLGKAIAGAQGRTNCQIFCNKSNAQVISVTQTCINPDLIPILDKPCRFFIQGNQIEYTVFFK
ncbi:MAG: hypothetical protein HRU38_16980 [Saccharospirillaceae bacterium]|nr:hypothetical protein [Pseudomonadales bacterium]NRB80332.1 hypothetical protein [Saccharospirillaceae bacterium]